MALHPSLLAASLAGYSKIALRWHETLLRNRPVLHLPRHAAQYLRQLMKRHVSVRRGKVKIKKNGGHGLNARKIQGLFTLFLEMRTYSQSRLTKLPI